VVGRKGESSARAQSYLIESPRFNVEASSHM
jgi:hypothetical protein